MNFYSEDEKFLIGNELQKLFAFQDRNLTKEAKSLFINEFEASGIPPGAMIHGIRSLITEDLRQIKLNHILAAARGFMTQETRESTKCDDCRKSGIVIMRDSDSREFALACHCQNGVGLNRAAGLVRWAGERTQMSGGRLLTAKWAA